MLTLLYRIYQFCIVLPVGLLLTVLTATVTSIGCALLNAHFWGYWPGRIWSQCLCRLLLLPIRVEGREHLQRGQSYVFVANHQGPLDIFLIYGFLGRNFKWMMKKALRRTPFIGYACARAHHIFVDKSGPKKIQETYNQARRTLRGGTSLVVFPEGARTFTGHMGIFRKGAFQLADELQLPVVPLTIDGSFDALPRMAGFGFVKHQRLRLVIHEPIAPQGRGADEVRRTLDESYRVIMSALPARHQGFVKNDDQ